ncbi:fibroblast growth factor receptor 1-like isoform X2 [Planococcus citri]|uniref:fibroblast growth factor receptor 1-like isoform X2 n=1 Tax=Planococcus citri TaxID=170843 RepID=UPI0031F82285
MRHCFLFMFAVLLCIVKNSDCMETSTHEPDEPECETSSLLFDQRETFFQETNRCKEGGAVDLECPVCGTKADIAEIEWLMNDKPPNKWPRPIHREFKGFQLKIKECEEENEGNYTCIVYPNGTKTENISHTFQVRVEKKLPPTEFITEKPQNNTVKLGDSWSFKCPLKDPSLEIHWYKVNLLTTNYTPDMQDVDNMGHDAEELHFLNVSLEDAGWYSCRVLDQESREASASAYLTVTNRN